MAETILIVDDSTFIVEGLVALLKKKYRPIPCFSGEECLSILRSTMPSLIILDIMMEPMDGWETLSRIKADERSRHIPVLMFSAKKISPEEAEAHRIIIDDFITKPVNPQKLLEAIEKVLVRQTFNRQVLTQWTAAGVSPALIDQYLTLKMNLDVDISLLAVMHRQLDIAYAGAANREEIARSIATIEERIASTRALIESFCREQAGMLPPLDTGGVPQEGGQAPEAVPSPGPEVTASTVVAALPVAGNRESAVSEKPGENAREESDHITDPGTQPAPSVPAGHDMVPVPAGEPARGVLPPAAPEEPAHEAPALTPPATPRPALEPPLFSAPAPVPAVPELVLPGSDEQPGPAPVTPLPRATQEGADDLFEPFEAPDHSPSLLSPQAGMAESAGPNPPPTPAPARRSHLQQPGSGTVTPPMRSRAGTSRSGPEETKGSDPSGAGDAPPAPGIIARLISAILSLFRRPKG